MVDSRPAQGMSGQDSRLSLVTGKVVRCPACRDGGWVRADVALGHPDFGKLEMCPDCGQARKIKAITKRCGLTSSELKVRLADWRPGPWPDLKGQRAEARTVIVDAVRGRHGVLTFWGDYGAGKTMALQIIINELRLQGVPCHYVPFSVLAEKLRQEMFNADRRGAVELYWDRLVGIQALAIDEVTRFNPTGWARERLWMLADTRHRTRGELLTVMATNEDPTVALPTGETVGYLFSRMREGALVELRGDMRTAAP